MGSFTNSEYPDEMPDEKRSSDKKIQYVLKIIT